MQINIYLNIIILLLIFLIYFIVKSYKVSKESKMLKGLVSNVTIEQKDNDLRLVYDAIDRSILKSLLVFVQQDYNFSEKSSAKIYKSGKYRDLINYLIRPDILVTDNIDGEEFTQTFFSIFVQRVYYLYIAETSKYIKDLIFKYYSCYTPEEFQMKKLPKPSVINFITEYVQYWLMAKYEENINAEQKLFDIVRSQSPENTFADSYNKLLDEYDQSCVRELCLSIYHIYGNDVRTDIVRQTDSNNNESDKSDKKEVKKNEFAVDFHEQSK